MKTATKIVFLVCLVALIVVPIMLWVIDPERSLKEVAGFVGATSGPLGVLTGAMAARGISRDRKK
jgi:hypothetical protein